MKILLLDTDLYWLAGLLEGEGSFNLHTQKYPRISIQMIDKDIIERAANLFQTKCLGPYGPYTTQKLPTYCASVIGDPAGQLMEQLLPLMGLRRKEQITLALNHWYNNPIKTENTPIICGHPEKKHSGHGLCSSCYMHAYREKKNSHLTVGH